MEVILIKDIKGLGYKNDLVDVKPGYGRNFLIPQRYALMATAGNVKQRNENTRQAAHKADKLKQDAESLANAIGDEKLTILAKAGESGKIFGAVTPNQISDALKAKGHDIDRKQISIKGDVKTLGEYTAEIDLHKEVKKDVTFEVVAAE